MAGSRPGGGLRGLRSAAVTVSSQAGRLLGRSITALSVLQTLSHALTRKSLLQTPLHLIILSLRMKLL